MKYCEIIADTLSEAGWSWGCVATINCEGRTIFGGVQMERELAEEFRAAGYTVTGGH